MTKRILIAISILLVPLTAFAAEPDDAKTRWHHQPGEHLSMSAGGVTLWTYHFATDAGFPWIHPLKTTDGTTLTALAPPDHPWHRAVWFSWKYLDGVNYWDWGGRKDGVPEGQTRRVGKEDVQTGPDGATVTIRLEYAAADRAILNETRTIVFALPRDDGSYTMDWTSTFTAGEKDVVLERTPPKEKPWGGYAGLSFRGAGSLKEHRVIDSEGRVDREAHGKTARWMDFSGIGEKGTPVGIAIFDHPNNPRHPAPWYVSVGNMPYFGPAPIFHEPFSLSAGKSLVLKYRILVHCGRGEPAKLEAEYEAMKAAK